MSGAAGTFGNTASASDFAESANALGHLHPTAITSPEEIRRLLEQASADQTEFWRGMNRRILKEVARIDEIEEDSIVLSTLNFEPSDRDRVFLNFRVNGTPYFFSANLVSEIDDATIRVAIPSVVYQSERRDRIRRAPSGQDSTRAELSSPSHAGALGKILDASPQGMSLSIAEPAADLPRENLRVRFLDGSREGEEVFAEVRRQEPDASRPGWVRLGLDISAAQKTYDFGVLRGGIEDFSTPIQRVKYQAGRLAETSRLVAHRAIQHLRIGERSKPVVNIVDIENRDGDLIRSIVDSHGETRGAPLVVIPPAWGKTKESLMPLSLCLLAAFRAADEPVTVVRFDGIRKRGESHSATAGMVQGSENIEFTFSQGVRDLRTVINFFHDHPDFQPSHTIVVSFSASSIEARRAVADDPRVDGWVSVVGASDLQSMMKVISGGIDFAAGLERGISFGVQTILGIKVDMDNAGLDAFKHSLVTLEDARNDMARIKVPITWIHGKYDAWMNPTRALDILSRGESTKRKFIEVPTGHALRTSKEAIETFQIVTREVSGMIFSSPLPDELPDFVEITERARAERSRLPDDNPNLRKFWRDYLMGEDAALGIELMTSISNYQLFMRSQISALGLVDEDLVLDLGSGKGSFVSAVSAHPFPFEAVHIVELDFVGEALRATRDRIAADTNENRHRVSFVEADLELAQGQPSIPFKDRSIDAILVSLVLSYIDSPEQLIFEVARVLRPGGRVVVSSLRPDADMSKLFADGITELRSGLANQRFGEYGDREVEIAAREYLNHASHLLDIEESGRFRFWGRGEICDLLRSAGFENLDETTGFGDPAQAIITSGRLAKN